MGSMRVLGGAISVAAVAMAATAGLFPPFSAAQAQNGLPACPAAQPTASWTDCQGSVKYANGIQYVGEFRDGKRSGQGTVILPTGETYAGAWRDGKMNGKGILITPNGTKYIGEFRDGMLNGTATEYLPNGATGRSGLWANNSFAGAPPPPAPAPAPPAARCAAAGRSRRPRHADALPGDDAGAAPPSRRRWPPPSRASRRRPPARAAGAGARPRAAAGRSRRARHAGALPARAAGARARGEDKARANRPAARDAHDSNPRDDPVRAADLGARGAAACAPGARRQRGAHNFAAAPDADARAVAGPCRPGARPAHDAGHACDAGDDGAPAPSPQPKATVGEAERPQPKIDTSGNWFVVGVPGTQIEGKCLPLRNLTPKDIYEDAIGRGEKPVMKEMPDNGVHITTGGLDMLFYRTMEDCQAAVKLLGPGN